MCRLRVKCISGVVGHWVSVKGVVCQKCSVSFKGEVYQWCSRAQGVS